ncbi:MAG: hypothetical protein JSU01_14120, partial [Bacteroidetes bacterium]|nr:hypothetical protein [Bacteroidota bacterium]
MKKIAFLILFFLVAGTLFAQEQNLQKIIKPYGIPGIQLVSIKGNNVQNFNL